MTVEFRLVDIGEGLTEAEIVSWLVAVGDHVVEDQPVVEIETDKAVVEMPAPATGIVVALGGEPGQVIAVGELLVTIDEDGDAAAPADAARPHRPGDARRTGRHHRAGAAVPGDRRRPTPRHALHARPRPPSRRRSRGGRRDRAERTDHRRRRDARRRGDAGDADGACGNSAGGGTSGTPADARRR